MEKIEENKCEFLLSDALPVTGDDILYRKVRYLSTSPASCGSSLR